MTSICWKSAVTWSLLGLMFLLFILMVGPLPALAASPDAVLYEVTEDMYLKDAAGNFVSSVVQGDNDVDAPEFVVMTGTFKGVADLSLSMSGQAPLGYITSGVATIDGQPGASFKFTGTFRLPFSVDVSGGRHQARRELDAYYMDDHGHLKKIKDQERSLGVPTVKLEIEF